MEFTVVVINVSTAHFKVNITPKSGRGAADSLISLRVSHFKVGVSLFLTLPTPSPHHHFRRGDEDEEDTGEERLPSCFDYVMHFLTVFWKVLFACVPPTDYLNGWACFLVSIIIIGLLTAVIGDLASHFGCTIGLKDSVTAVVFVALGTSVPGEMTKDAERFCTCVCVWHLMDDVSPRSIERILRDFIRLPETTRLAQMTDIMLLPLPLAFVSIFLIEVPVGSINKS